MKERANVSGSCVVWDPLYHPAAGKGSLEKRERFNSSRLFPSFPCSQSSVSQWLNQQIRGNTSRDREHKFARSATHTSRHDHQFILFHLTLSLSLYFFLHPLFLSLLCQYHPAVRSGKEMTHTAHPFTSLKLSQ